MKHFLEDFKNALETILEKDVDLILLDINIPYINGEVLVKEIRKESNVPIIMVTSRDSETDEALSISFGADEKMINKALFSQIAIFFMFPLLLAIIHSYFGIKFCVFFLETFGTKGLFPSIMMTALFLIVIYGGYFLITYYCSKNIIKEKR